MTATVLARMVSIANVDTLLYHAAELATHCRCAASASCQALQPWHAQKNTDSERLIGRPPVIVIDELRNGLDPIAIKQSEDLIRQEKARGAAILAATHDLWWAERFATTFT